jgi:hypothetical protein
MADLDEHKLRDLEAAIATAIHQALVVGVDPKYIGGLLQEHLDSLSAEELGKGTDWAGENDYLFQEWAQNQ